MPPAATPAGRRRGPLRVARGPGPQVPSRPVLVDEQTVDPGCGAASEGRSRGALSPCPASRSVTRPSRASTATRCGPRSARPPSQKRVIERGGAGARVPRRPPAPPDQFEGAVAAPRLHGSPRPPLARAGRDRARPRRRRRVDEVEPGRSFRDEASAAATGRRLRPSPARAASVAERPDPRGHPARGRQ